MPDPATGRPDVNWVMRRGRQPRGQVCIHRDSYVSDDAIIYPFVFIGPYVTIGERCVIGPGACIGQPGFKYTVEDFLIADRYEPRLAYREHSAGVIIGDDVHVGANACIDQGRWRPTEIRSGAKIDNLVHVAHNVIVGENARIIALAELSGSVEVEPWAVVAPGAAVREHLTVGARATVGLGAAVVCDVPAGETWAGVPARKLEPKEASVAAVAKVKLTKDNAGEYRFAAIAGNGEIVATSEGYAKKDSAREEAAKLYPDALIVDEA